MVRIGKKKSRFHFDESAAFLIVANLVTLIAAVWEGWDLRDVMFIYWAQSVIIGFFSCRRILALQDYSTDGFELGDQPVEPTKKTKRHAAFAFAAVYGGFHLCYVSFLLPRFFQWSGWELWGIWLCVGVFALNHRFSFHHNVKRDLDRKPNIGTLVFFPYLRILPMHLTIIFGIGFLRSKPPAVVLFLVLKTVVDLLMHLIEHASESQNSTGAEDQPTPVTHESP